MEYQKIQTLFKRDPKDNVIIENDFVYPEIEWMKDLKFECTEKIDGTNMRVEIHDGIFEFKGRTDKAQIPEQLLSKMKEIFTEETITNMFNNWKNPSFKATIFGEGYGKKIQGCGGRYIKDGNDFILFDINVDGWWLKREVLEEIAKKGNIKIVPKLENMTIIEAINFVKKGFKSLVAEDNSLQAEGLVLKTPFGLKFRNNERILFKIKTIDFVNLFSKNFINRYPMPEMNPLQNPLKERILKNENIK